MWQQLDPDTLGSKSLTGFHFCFRPQLVDDDHFLQWVGWVVKICEFEQHPKVWRTQSTNQRGSERLCYWTLCLVFENFEWGILGHRLQIRCRLVSLCRPANQKVANLITSKFPCSRSCTLFTLYPGTSKQYLIVTTVMRCLSLHFFLL